MRCTHTAECYSAMKKSEIVPFAEMWMDPDTHHKRSKGKNHTLSVICEIQTIIQMNLQNRNTLTCVENKLMLTKGEGEGGINLEVRISRYTLVYIKQKLGTIYIRNYIQDPIISERT